MIKITDETELKQLERCRASEDRIEVDGVIHTCVDMVRALRLVNEALCPGGKAVVSVPNGILAWDDPRARRQLHIATFKAFERAPVHPSFFTVRSHVNNSQLVVEMTKA